MIADEKAFAEYVYVKLTETLKERIRPDYPQIDTLPEAEAVELCLAHGRARKTLLQCGA